MSGEGSYAPKSPDLSSFFATPDPVRQQQQIPPYPQYSQPAQLPYQQPPPPQQGFPPSQHLQPPQPSYYQPPPQYGNPQPQYIHTQSPQQQPPPPAPPQQPPHPTQTFYTSAPQQSPPPYGVQPPPPSPLQQPAPQQQQQQQYYQGYGNPQYEQYESYEQYGVQQQQGYQQPPGAFLQPNAYQPLQQGLPGQQQPPLPPSPVPRSEPTPSSFAGMPPRRAAAPPPAAGSVTVATGGPSSSSSAAVANTVMPSPVKTKFPTARIKRIMQADEEVGKVSQQTPIAVGKALELFMIALVTRSADVARTKNSKRVTAPMLKQVVESDDQWDFLRDIVKKVDPEEKHARGAANRNSTGGADGSAAPGGVKMKFDSESEEERPKKRGRPGRKKTA